MAVVHTELNESWGVITGVDPVNRVVNVWTDGAVCPFDVHRGSLITLRGERVKLRIIQPRDAVRILFRRDGSALVAEVIDVHSLGPNIERAARPVPNAGG